MYEFFYTDKLRPRPIANIRPVTNEMVTGVASNLKL